MNKTSRSAVVSRALSDAFSPQFAKLQQLLRKEVEKQIPTRFTELVNDDSIKQWVGFYSVNEIYLVGDEGSKRMCLSPVFENCSGNPPMHIYRTDGNFSKIKITDLKVPHELREPKISSMKLIGMHSALWESYSEAYKAMNSLVNSYRSRDKFIKDFPEYKKYLPEKVTATKLPVVIVSDVRKSLADFGLPS